LALKRASLVAHDARLFTKSEAAEAVSGDMAVGADSERKMRAYVLSNDGLEKRGQAGQELTK
jgi:hypothetical protein